jgi:hypothetical protein
VKTDIWPDDTSMLQMNHWLAELGDHGSTQLPTGRHARQASVSAPRPRPAAARAPDWPAAPVGALAAPVGAFAPVEAFAAQARARAEAHARAEDHARARARAQAQALASAPITERAVIGDALRMPIMWCEMGSCVCWYSDPAALGEADIRARALSAGWRVDALRRLACPCCQQTDPGFRAIAPVVLWDRHTAVTRAARMIAGRREAAGRLHS